ncbi:MAG: hypothetical protein ACPLPT_07645 [Moorellales bacterium]
MFGAPVACSCCGPSGLRIIEVGGDQVGIIGLDEALAEVRSLGLADEEAIKDELLRRISTRNYIPEGDEPHYRKALYREYLRKAR